MPNTLVTINSRKFDGSIHRSWSAELLSQSNDLLTFVGKFEFEVRHPFLGIIRPGTVSYEYYWKNHWFNVFRFHEPDGSLRNFYCNINQPPKFDDGILDYVDLDIDVLVWKDYTHQILDLDEFEKNSVLFQYPKSLYDNANSTLRELLLLIEHKAFPFDYKI